MSNCRIIERTDFYTDDKMYCIEKFYTPFYCFWQKDQWRKIKAFTHYKRGGIEGRVWTASLQAAESALHYFNGTQEGYLNKRFKETVVEIDK
jgi:hypothetical protein